MGDRRESKGDLKVLHLTTNEPTMKNGLHWDESDSEEGAYGCLENERPKPQNEKKLSRKWEIFYGI